MSDTPRVQPPLDDEKFIATITKPLRENSWVRRRLPGWGRLHIDRRLPFLCVYRRPAGRPDPGTKSLLLGEASYLLASGEPDQHGRLSSLVQEIARIQGAAFGAFLVLEIWAEETVDEPPAFRIVAPDRDVPAALLEALENNLLGVCVDKTALGVTVEYRERCAPPGLPPLLCPAGRGRMACLQLGLGVPALYRDSATGALFPFELERFRHDLGRALKKTFYTFSHRFTRHRPAHFHELGRHAMTPVVQEADVALAGISRDFDILLHVTPVNVVAAWDVFCHARFSRPPEFHYRPRPLQPARLKRRLYEIPLERIEDPTLAALFAAKREELDRQITLIADRGTRRFFFGSQQIYGEVDGALLQQARQLIQRLPPKRRKEPDAPVLDAAAFAVHARQELERYRQQCPDFSARLEVREDVSGLMVSRGNLLIGADVQVPAGRVAAALAHEVGTHVLTWHNGGRQPFRQLQVGLAGYEALQEGLAVLAEYLVGGLDSSRLRLLAGRVVAVHCLSEGAGFIETFRELNGNSGFPEYSAFLIAMRVFRGGGFTKDVVYLRGLVELLDYLGEGGEIEPLLLGKIALEHLPFIKELQWRRVLESAPLRPHYLEMDEAKSRLARLRQHPSLQTLTEEKTG